jgi:hypothetical protein
MDLGVLLAVLLGIGLALALMVTRKNPKTTKSRHQKEVLNKKVVQERWQEIENTFELGGQSRFKSAILDADKLVDYVLKGLNVRGETMGERLKNAKSKFKNHDDYNNLWFAHKVRNNVAHEVDHELNHSEAKRAFEYYKKALKVLGVL